MNDLYSVIKGPCLTEKGNLLKEANDQVVIKVAPSATKIDIRNAVEKIFNVKVDKIRTSTVHGKQKRVGRYSGYKSDWKKAVITLKEGKLNFLEDI